MEETYIRGNTIKYIRVPEEVQGMQLPLHDTAKGCWCSCRACIPRFTGSSTSNDIIVVLIIYLYLSLRRCYNW
jgi:hypothetical protein